MKSTKPLAMGDYEGEPALSGGAGENLLADAGEHEGDGREDQPPPITPTRSASPGSTRPAAQGMSQKVSAASRAVSTQQRAGTGFFQSR